MFLMEVSHPNIIKLEEVIRADNHRDIYLVFEHMDIDLYTVIKENILAERHRKYIFYQMCKALHYLHTAGLIHRDVKPSNVLLNENCDAKLCDFGLVRSLEDQDPTGPIGNDILTEYIATRWYRAP